MEGEIEEEIIKAVKKLKGRKATGNDGIPNEAWIEGIDQVKGELKECLDKVWKEGQFPEEWKTGKMKPIFKKGKKEEVGNYRGKTLMDTGYKIYVEILRNRLDEQLEREGNLDDTQFGFRKKRGTMDAVYTLKNLIGGEITKEKGKVWGFLADMKAAFDKIKREEIWKKMEELGVEEGLRERIKEIYEDTRCEIEVGKKIIGSFRTDKGVRQGCPLSPTLFNIAFADVEKEMRKAQEGGVRLGKKKIFTLAYADDVILLANNDTGMRDDEEVQEIHREEGVRIKHRKVKGDGVQEKRRKEEGGGVQMER